MNKFEVYDFDNIPIFNKPIFILGSFESFHIGHNLLLDEANKINKNNDRDIVLVFFKDIENIYKSKSQIFTDFENRLQEFANLNFKKGLYLEFKKIWNLPYEEFLNILLKKQKNFDLIFGEDFKFGHNAIGNAKLIKEKFGSYAHAIEALKLNNNQKISTSYLKSLLDVGDIKMINTLNMFTYSFSGKLILANDYCEIIKNEFLLPLPAGLYAAYLEIDGMNYYSVLKVNFNTKYFFKLLDYSFKKVAPNYNIRIKVLDTIRFFRKNEVEAVEEKDLIVAKQIFLH